MTDGKGKRKKGEFMRQIFKAYITPVVFISLITIFGLGIFGCTQFSDPNSGQTGTEPDIPPQNSTKLDIHFLELGNQYTGDSIYIKYGDVEILVDAGSRKSSAPVIRNYIDQNNTDGKLEYVIVTHAHQDHIEGFTESDVFKSILTGYEIGTIIDFPLNTSTSNVFSNYKTAIAAAEQRGAVHYNALQCFNNEGGAQRVYDLGDGVKLEILYSYYYDHTQKNGENDFSVCFRIIQGANQYIFTGDLEKNGEDRLVDYYAQNFGGLGHCVLYKAGHHGSVTSSNTKLMSAITPEYVFVTACVGTSEYTSNNDVKFPSQDFINRVAPYTDKVYATTYAGSYPAYSSFNGNIVFSASNGNFDVNCSNNNLILKETVWFQQYRTMPAAWK